MADLIKELELKVKQLEHEKQQLMNRCMAMTQGTMCIFCGFKENCEPLSGIKKADEPQKKVRNRSNIFG